MTRLVAESDTMTVGELISALSSFSADTPVYYHGSGWALQPIDTVDNEYEVDDMSGTLFHPAVIE